MGQLFLDMVLYSLCKITGEGGFHCFKKNNKTTDPVWLWFSHCTIFVLSKGNLRHCARASNTAHPTWLSAQGKRIIYHSWRKGSWKMVSLSHHTAFWPVILFSKWTCPWSTGISWCTEWCICCSCLISYWLFSAVLYEGHQEEKVVFSFETWLYKLRNRFF